MLGLGFELGGVCELLPRNQGGAPSSSSTCNFAVRFHGAQDAVETLNFEKSRVGLGDIYAKQYEAQGWQRDAAAWFPFGEISAAPDAQLLPRLGLRSWESSLALFSQAAPLLKPFVPNMGLCSGPRGVSVVENDLNVCLLSSASCPEKCAQHTTFR